MKWLIAMLCFSGIAGAQIPDQVTRWKAAEIRPVEILRLDKAVALYNLHKERYLDIEHMRKGGVPAPIIFTLHGRESTWNFARHLHEGSLLSNRTRNKPKNRPLTPDPPYTFEQSSEDALYILKHLDHINWRDMQAALQTIEQYNGLGYQLFHPDVPSPYLWSGTTLYRQGKYIADGKFSRTAIDEQLGCAAILKRMQFRRIQLPF